MSLDLDQSNTTSGGPRLARRSVLWAAAWSVPVIVVVNVARTSVASDAPAVLTATTPAPAFTADDRSPGQALTVSFREGDQPVAGEDVMFFVSADASVDATWLSFTSTTVPTSSRGVASTVLRYGEPKPPAGSTVMVLALCRGQSVSWRLTYQPAAVATSPAPA